ncbi:MAG TPA: DHA2 family efflux MFS transporter permease subunit [Planctomycetota bacterium]|nr:DHA2 family efflux MFS transporter permease subunit [Planctomycetota bacterium]
MVPSSPPSRVALRPPSAAELSPQAPRFLPWLAAIALFMENLDTTIINTAIPTMSTSLDVAPLRLKSVLTSYTLSLAVFIPISGWLADRFGTRKVFGMAILLFLLGSLFCGLSTTIPFLVASRILQGAGGAMMTPVGRLALVRSFPRSQMIATLNFVLLPALIGPLLGPFLGGLIVHWFHWRVIFFINIPFALLGLALVPKQMPDFRADAPSPLDAWGFVLFGIGIALLSYVLEVFGEHRLSGAWMGAFLVAAAVFLAAYGVHARRAPAPMLDLGLFRLRSFRVAVIGGFLTRLGVGGTPFLLPLLYQIGMGFPAWQAGLLTMPQAAAAMAMRVVNRPILAAFGHKRVLLANTAILAVTLMAFSRVGPGTPIAWIVALSFVQGFLSSLQFTSANTLVYANVEDERASRASSISSTGQQLALSFGVATASLLTAWFLGGTDRGDPGRLVPAIHLAFWALGGFTLLSGALFATLHPDDGRSISNYRESSA